MPALRMLDHLAVGEFPHLLADGSRACRRARRRRPSRRAPRTISSTSRARLAAVLPEAISASTSPPIRAATAAAVRPRSAGRTISPWLIGMPPWIWARYSPSPMRTSSCSISAKLAAGVHALGVGGKLPHRFDIGRKPGQARGWRAARGRAAAPTSSPLSTTRSRTLAVASANSASTAPVAALRQAQQPLHGQDGNRGLGAVVAA